MAAGLAGTNVAKSFGAVVILKRDPATGAIAETGCLSSDGTDGRDGASGACTAEPSLLGARGVAVSPDGSTVFVSSSSSASVVAFSRDPATGTLTRVGCFQGTPRPGAPCGAANLFASSSSLVVNAEDRALYVAAPLEGAISTLNATSATTSSPIAAAGPATGTSSATGATPGPSTPPAGTTLASIFTSPPPSTFLLNPCIGVNGLDGVCSVGTATQGLGSLTLSADGKQLYASAPESKAIDVFATGDGSVLTEISCLKVDAPPGLCAPSTLISAPGRIAVSPDGKNVYATDVLGDGGSIDELDRDAATGSLKSSGCVDFLPEPPKPEPGEEEDEEAKEEREDREAAPKDPCTSVPGLNNASAIAVSGDGSSVYAIGSGSAAIFSRDAATGKLTETSCAVDDDERCTSLPTLSGVTDAAVSSDGREVYVVATESNAVMAFSIGAAVTTARAASASRAGATRVRVSCPAGLRRSCRGSVEAHARRSPAHATPLRARAARRDRTLRLVLPWPPGHQRMVGVRLTRSGRALLLRRHRLRTMAVVHARVAAGGSGYGRAMTLRLGDARTLPLRGHSHRYRKRPETRRAAAGPAAALPERCTSLSRGVRERPPTRAGRRQAADRRAGRRRRAPDDLQPGQAQRARSSDPRRDHGDARRVRESPARAA